MNQQDTQALDYAPAQPRAPRRILLLAVEVLLILITVGLIVATWMPAIVGPSEGRSAQDRARSR